MGKIIERNNALKINVDEITSYKSFINNPQLIENKVLAVVKNDELMFYAVSPSLIKNLSKVNVSVTKTEEANHDKHKFVDVLNEWLHQKSLLWTPRHLAEVQRRTNKDLITFFRRYYESRYLRFY